MLYQLSYLPAHSCTYVTITQSASPVNGVPLPDDLRRRRVRERTRCHENQPGCSHPISRCRKFHRNAGAVAPTCMGHSSASDELRHADFARHRTRPDRKFHWIRAPFTGVALAPCSTFATADDPSVGAISQCPPAGGGLRGEPADDLSRPGDTRGGRHRCALPTGAARLPARQELLAATNAARRERSPRSFDSESNKMLRATCRLGASCPEPVSPRSSSRSQATCAGKWRSAASCSWTMPCPAPSRPIGSRSMKPSTGRCRSENG